MSRSDKSEWWFTPTCRRSAWSSSMVGATQKATRSTPRPWSNASRPRVWSSFVAKALVSIDAGLQRLVSEGLDLGPVEPGRARPAVPWSRRPRRLERAGAQRDEGHECTRIENSSPSPGRRNSYHRKASSISDAAAGGTMTCFTDCGYEFDSAPCPRGSPLAPRHRARQAVGRARRADTVRSEKGTLVRKRWAASSPRKYQMRISVSMITAGPVGPGDDPATVSRHACLRALATCQRRSV